MDLILFLIGLVFIFVLFPISIIVTIVKLVKKSNFKIWGFSILISFFLGVSLVVVSLFIPSSETSNEMSVKNVSENKIVIVEESNKETKNENNAQDVFVDNIELKTIGQEKQNLKSAVESIGMDYSNVKNITELDDWASGHRYSFVYDGFGYIVYELDNNEINTIVTEYKRSAIYERGYKPLNYKDFEPDKNVLQSIQSDSISQMTKYINGATSLDIKTGSMLYARIYDYYSLSGEVKAKNAIDKEVYTFTADYMINDGSIECVYLAIDGNIVHGSDDFAPKLQKVELQENNSEAKSDCIVLSDGKTGEYGQYDLFDGEKYLRYYVPTGNYTVRCNIRGGFYIETIELHKEDGWDTATTIKQIDIKQGDEINITVEEGQCISLYINTEIELYKQ